MPDALLMQDAAATPNAWCMPEVFQHYYYYYFYSYYSYYYYC